MDIPGMSDKRQMRKCQVGERVAAYKRVRHIEFTDQIPRSPAGKILRRLLVEQDA